MTWPVLGLMLSKVAPDAAWRSCPSISSLVSCDASAWVAADARISWVVLMMQAPLLGGDGSGQVQRDGAAKVVTPVKSPAFTPPSVASSAPVIAPARSLLRKSAACACSSVVCGRPSGMG